jgi:enoyl-CoA hydratase/carnithine racemase
MSSELTTSTPAVLLSAPLPGVALITLNRPDVRNPLDIESVLEAHRILDSFEAGAKPLRVCIFTGAPPAFSAGGDLTKYLDLYRSKEAFGHFLAELGRLLERLEQGSFVSIAMINGVCVAGGLELVLACDLAVAAESSTIGDLHINYAQLPGAGGSQRLVRAVGTIRARDLLLTGQLLSASEARAIGLVSRVVADEMLLDETLAIAGEIAGRSPECIARMKELVEIAVSEPLPRGLALERALVAEYATTSADAREGLIAFAERRAPVFGEY